jgi:Leucine-rich repeat (LRR) protein
LLICSFLSFPEQTELFVLIKNIFIFRSDSANCSHKNLNPEARNLKIRPKFLNYETVITAADIYVLQIDFAPSTHIFSGISETFSNLQILLITFQSIRFVERSDFVGLTRLTDLRLGFNQFEFLPEDVFWDLKKLEVLNLVQNKIKKLPENIFKNLKKLKKIFLNGNKIEHFPENLFVNNLEIEEIWAEKNPLKTIEVDFTALKNLRELYLTDSNCINVDAHGATQVQEAQRLINQNCSKTTQE